MSILPTMFCFRSCVGKGRFILKTDRMHFEVPLSDFLCRLLCSVQINGLLPSKIDPARILHEQRGEPRVAGNTSIVSNGGDPLRGPLWNLGVMRDKNRKRDISHC